MMKKAPKVYSVKNMTMNKVFQSVLQKGLRL
ncbi:MAG: hypothetical protein JWQ84_967 [Mucilaginibacter sp.]|nr:hypothetical protein [Mucilaginibacter sp.]